MANPSNNEFTNFCGFSGPGQAVINNADEPNRKVLPISHGDVTVNVSENEFVEKLDEFGESEINAYSLGGNIDIAYPMKIADMTAFAMVVSQRESALVTTEDPDGIGSSNPLVARQSIQGNVGVRLKETFEFTLWRTMDALFDAAGTVITRTADTDKFGVQIDKARAVSENNTVATLHNGESTYTLNVRGLMNDAGTAVFRIFNTDLAVA